MNQSTYQPWFSTSQPCSWCLSTKGSINLHNQNHREKKEKQLIMVSWSHECKYEIYTRGVSIGCAVVEDAKSSCCILWIRLHLYWKIDVNTFPFLLYIKPWRKSHSKLDHYGKEDPVLCHLKHAKTSNIIVNRKQLGYRLPIW